MTGEAQQRWTGQSITRVEDTDFVTGRARYTADLREPLLDGSCFAVFVRSPFASASIETVDVEAAEAAPGVVSVATAASLDGLHRSPYALPFEDQPMQPMLAGDEVRFAGEIVAAVVAETPEQATDAAEMVLVDYVERVPVLDLDEAIADAPVPATERRADHEPAKFDSAEVVSSIRVWSPRQTPAPIEPRAVAAVWSEDERDLHVWSATQRPHGFRDSLSTFTGVPAERIHVVAPAVGGGFGGKPSRSAEEHVVPVLARIAGRPVRWHETRSENFLTGTQCRGERIDVSVAGSRDGSITALRAELLKDGGAYPLVGVVLPDGYTRPMASGCYDIEHVEFSSFAVLTNRVPTSAYRGAGRSPYVNALERAIDVFALDCGLDPAEVRRRNLIEPADMPYTAPTGGVYDEADYPADLEAALALVGYRELRDEQARRRSSPDALMGIGIASYNHMTTGGGGEEASVTLGTDGSITVVTGSTSQGHGHATTWAQIAADAMGVDPDDVAVTEGDSDAIATGVGAVGSRSLQTAGLAVHNSAAAVLERAKQLAARLLEAAADDIVSTAGVGLHVVGTPSVAVSWPEVAAAGLGSPNELSCGEFYDTEGRNTFPSGCHVAVVELDSITGAWTLRRLVAVDDAGPRVNPAIVEGQIHGGIASGFGQVAGEVAYWDENGTPLTTNFADYPLPSADQLPSFELGHAATPSSFNALGFKGVGESGTIGATAAVHNAVVDAVSHLGVRHIDLPCTRERVWRAIRDADTGGD